MGDGMAHAYVDTTKQGRERYSGPMTYAKLGEAAIDLAWARTNEPEGEDSGAFDLWWLHALDQSWWASWMELYRQEAREIYESVLKTMRADVPEQRTDALTRLEQMLRRRFFAAQDDAAALISEARKEMEALEIAKNTVQRRLAVAHETINSLSSKSSEALRMGQQQGRVELAQEILTEIDKNGLRDIEATLRAIVDMDAGQ